MSVEEAKKHLEIAADFTVHDDHILELIDAAQETWEHDTHSCVTLREITEQLKQVDTEVRLSLRPVTRVISVAFDGVNVDSSTYQLFAGRRVIELPESHSGDSWSAVTIVYEAGYAIEDVPAMTRQAMKLQLDLTFQPGKEIPHHQKAYENLVKKRLRSTYP